MKHGQRATDIKLSSEQYVSQNTIETAENRNENATRLDRVELHSYYKAAAEDLVREANLPLDVPQSKQVVQYSQDKQYVGEILESKVLNAAMDFGLSRSDIIKAAENLISNREQRNNAATKQLELVLDKMLTDGYVMADGRQHGPNEEYIQAKVDIPSYLEAAGIENATTEPARLLVEKQQAGGYTDTGKTSRRRITDEERSALMSYKSGGSYSLNAKLREGLGLSEIEQKIVAGLDTVLPKLPAHKGAVYRNIGFDGFGDQEALNDFVAQHEEGSLVTYPAYTSTSTSKDGYPVDGDFIVHMVIKGVTGRDLAGYGDNSESEILFEREKTFEVSRVEFTSNGTPTIYMTEVIENGEDDQRGGAGSADTVTGVSRGVETGNTPGGNQSDLQQMQKESAGSEVQRVPERDSESNTAQKAGLQEVPTEVEPPKNTSLVPQQEGDRAARSIAQSDDEMIGWTIYGERSERVSTVRDIPMPEENVSENKVKDSEVVKLVHGSEKVSARTLGITDGTEKQSVYAVEVGETEATWMAKQQAQHQHLDLVLFVGGNLEIKKGEDTLSTPCYVEGNKVYVRADHPVYTAAQLMKREVNRVNIEKEREIHRNGLNHLNEIEYIDILKHERNTYREDSYTEEQYADMLSQRKTISMVQESKPLPIDGNANSIIDLIYPTGNVKQRRVYGPEGKAIIDYDTDDHNRPKFHPTGAHKHFFNYQNKIPRGGYQPLTSGDIILNSDIIREGENYHAPRIGESN